VFFDGASVNVHVKAGPMYWDTPVIRVILPSSRIIVRLPSSYWGIPLRAAIAATVGRGAARVP
jgi:hypothetical protein